jgi:hypothetical protein
MSKVPLCLSNTNRSFTTNIKLTFQICVLLLLAKTRNTRRLAKENNPRRWWPFDSTTSFMPLWAIDGQINNWVNGHADWPYMTDFWGQQGHGHGSLKIIGTGRLICFLCSSFNRQIFCSSSSLLNYNRYASNIKNTCFILLDDICKIDIECYRQNTFGGVRFFFLSQDILTFRFRVIKWFYYAFSVYIRWFDETTWHKKSPNSVKYYFQLAATLSCTNRTNSNLPCLTNIFLLWSASIKA